MTICFVTTKSVSVSQLHSPNMQQPFFLNILLTTFGIRFASRTRGWLLWIVNVFFLITITAALNVFTVNLVALISLQFRQLFYFCKYIVKVGTATIYLLCFLRKTNGMSKFIDDVHELLDKQSRSTLKRWDFGYFLVTVAVFAIWTVVTQGDVTRLSDPTSIGIGIESLTDQLPIPTSTTYIIAAYYCSFMINMVMACVYSWTQVSLRKMSLDVLNMISIMRPSVKLEARCAVHLYLRTTSLRAKHNQLFGLIPLVISGTLFMTLTLSITDLLTNSNSYHKRGYQALMYLMYFDSTLLLILLVMLANAAECATRAQQKLRDTIVGAFSDTMLEVDGHKYDYLMKYSTIIEMNPVLPSMAWNMFELRRTFIIQFLGALVPFTVMIVTTILQFVNRGG